MQHKRWILLTMAFAFVMPCLMTGCQPKPELPASSYGKVVDQLPDLPEAKEKYKFPDYVDLKHTY